MVKMLGLTAGLGVLGFQGLGLVDSRLRFRLESLPCNIKRPPTPPNIQIDFQGFDVFYIWAGGGFWRIRV